MLKELINKLKSKKQQLQNCKTDIETKKLEEANKVDIIISAKGNIYKIEISDYISIGDYVEKMRSSDEYCILNLLCNSILWNCNKQKVNKGIYYVITIDNRIYNILFTDEKIKIGERIKVELDEQTQKEDIIQERVITFNLHKNEYHYYSAKHELNGNTYYTKYYNKNKLYNLGVLDLSEEEETYEEIKSVIYNLESIEELRTILDIEMLKEHILKSLDKSLQLKKLI